MLKFQKIWFYWKGIKELFNLRLILFQNFEENMKKNEEEKKQLFIKR